MVMFTIAIESVAVPLFDETIDIKGRLDRMLFLISNFRSIFGFEDSSKYSWAPKLDPTGMNRIMKIIDDTNDNEKNALKEMLDVLIEYAADENIERAIANCKKVVIDINIKMNPQFNSEEEFIHAMIKQGLFIGMSMGRPLINIQED